ncbi:MAG: TonB-dependent receptor [Alphaproteobacteria bacterium]|nr:TonB-dependent receptor [Alphaproteobacteria bacterium]
MTSFPSRSNRRKLLSRRAARRTAALLGATIIVSSGVSGAQTLKGSDALLEPISVTATEVAPGGVQVREDQLDRANPLDIKDVFSAEASVNVGGGSDVSRKIYVNGIEDTNLNVKIDGARQVNSAFHHLGTAIIDPGLLKSVRVETGVGPADVGPGSLGGSIAFETKDARDLLDQGEAFGGYGKLVYDSNAHGFNEILALAAQYQGFEALIYGSTDGGNNFEDGADVEVDGTAPEMRNILGKFAWSGRAGSRVEVNVAYLVDEGIRPNRANFGALTNGAPTTFQQFNRRTYSISYADENPTDLVNPEFVLSYNRSSLFIDELAFGPSTFDLHSETVSYNGKLANTFSTDLGVFHSGKITAGFDFYRDEGRGDIEGGFGGAIPLVNTERSTNVGAFVQARMALSDQLRISLGGRFDRQRFEGIEGTKIDGSGLSGNVNVEYEPVPGFTPYVGAGTTYGGIPLGESAIYNFAGQWQYGGLTSSRSANYKVGVRAEKGPFSGDVNFYYNEIYDTHDRGSVVRNTTRNLLSRGLNVSGKYDYGDGFVRGAYARNHFRSDGNFLATGSASFHGLQLGSLLTAEAAHDFTEMGLRFGGSVERALDDDANPVSTADGYTVVNLYAQFTPLTFDAVTLRVDVKNLFDRIYVDRATAGGDNARVIPFNEPGRTFLLTAKLEF